MNEPRIKEVRVHFGGEGKVAIKDYGKISSGYSANITRAYEMPSDWTHEQVMAFELRMLTDIHDQLEPVLQAEYDERYDVREWD